MRITIILLLAALTAAGQQLNPNILWGVTGAGTTWRLNTYNLDGPPWRQVTTPAGVKARQVTIAHDGSVFLLGDDFNVANIYTLGNNGEWRIAVPGVLAQVAPAGARDVWGVSPSGHIFRWQAPNPGFAQVAANFTATQVSVAQDGTVWALDTAGLIYSYDGTNWLRMPGILRNVTVVGANAAWGVAPGNSIWRWDGITWSHVPPPANAIPSQTTAAADGTVYLNDSNGLLYLRQGESWRLFPGVLTQISASNADRYFYDDPAVVQSPGSSWSRQTNTSAGAGGYIQSSKAGDELTFKFNGDSFSLHRLMGPTGGWARVSVDGRDMGTIDFYASQWAWFVPAVIDGLGPGEHTLVLTVSPFKTAASTGNQVNLDSICAPAPQRPQPHQTAALALANQRRAQMGLPTARLSTALNLTAQSHANFMAVNDRLNHDQVTTGIGFTGVRPSDRARYFGYDVFHVATETINNAFDPESSIGFWVDTIYHRTGIQSYYNTDIGYGATMRPKEMAAMNYGSRSRPGPPATRLYSTFPGNNQRDVPLGYTVDAPDPRLADPATLGYVISMQVVHPSDVLRGNSTVPFSATLTDDTGRSIPVFGVTKENDPHPSLHPLDYFVMIPREPLAPNTTYTARMVGTDTTGNGFDVTWQFSSAPNSTITIERGVRFSYTDDSTTARAFLNYTTAGPVALTQTSVAYGTTTALDRRAQPTAAGTNRFAIELTDLPRGTLVYYRIAATDAQGRTSTTKIIPIRVP
jgi:uncharacterized protein YkwD